MANPRRALVTLPDGVWRIIRNDLKGKLGDGDSEIIRNMIISYLTAEGYFGASNVESNIIDELQSRMTKLDESLNNVETEVLTVAALMSSKGIFSKQEFFDQVNKTFKNTLKTQKEDKKNNT